MKAITVRQPWAWLLFHGKPLENRDWYTGYRGVLAIHSSLKMTRAEYDDALEFVRRFDQALADLIPPPKELVYGAVLGSVIQTGSVTSHSSPFFQGKFGHVYSDPRELPLPVVCGGHLGLWDLLPEAETAIVVQRALPEKAKRHE